MGVEIFVGISVAVGWGFAKAGGLADDGFEQVLPGKAWKHKGFIVKPSRKKPGHEFVGGPDIKLETGPMVLAGSG